MLTLVLNPRVCFKSIHQNTAININNFAYPNTSRWKLLLLLWSVFWYVKNRWPEVSKRQHLSSKPQWRSNRAACVSRAFQTSDFYLHEGLFSCSFGIRRVPRFQVSCGQDHSLFLTESGKVFACGWGADGQTGWCASGRQTHNCETHKWHYKHFRTTKELPPFFLSLLLTCLVSFPHKHSFSFSSSFYRNLSTVKWWKSAV